MKYVYRIWIYTDAARANEIAFLPSFKAAFNYILAQGEITQFTEETDGSYWNRRFFTKEYFSEKEWEKMMSPKQLQARGRRYCAGGNTYKIEKIKLEG